LPANRLIKSTDPKLAGDLTRGKQAFAEKSGAVQLGQRSIDGRPMLATFDYLLQLNETLEEKAVSLFLKTRPDFG